MSRLGWAQLTVGICLLIGSCFSSGLHQWSAAIPLGFSGLGVLIIWAAQTIVERFETTPVVLPDPYAER